MSEDTVMARGVLTVITDKQRARGLLRSSLERLGYRVVTFEDTRLAAAYVEADMHLLDSGATSDLSGDLHRLEESAPVLILMPPGTVVSPAFRQASAGFIAMSAHAEEYALRLEIASASSAGNGYRIATPRHGVHMAEPSHVEDAPADDGEIADDAPADDGETAAATSNGAASNGGAPNGSDAGPAPPVAPAPPAAGHRVALVADPDVDARHLSMFRLRGLGFEPVEAASVSAAVDLAARRDLALALLADDMSPNGGLDLLERVRAARGGGGPAAILTTGVATEAEDARAGASGAALLRKPFSADDLAECVGRVSPGVAQTTITSNSKETT